MKHWRVEVHIEGEKVLSIESDGMLAGAPNIEEFGDEIRLCGQHLLGFAGSGESICFMCDADPCECDDEDLDEDDSWMFDGSGMVGDD